MHNKLATPPTTRDLTKLMLPSWEQVATQVKKYGPASVASGAGLAGLSYLVSEMRQSQNDKKKREKAREGSTDVLTVEIPNRKTASMRSLLTEGIRGAGRIIKNNPVKTTGAVVAAGTVPAVWMASSSEKNTGGQTPSPQNAAPPPKESKGKPKRPDGSSWGWHSPLVAGTIVGGSALGYGIIDTIIKRRRRAEQARKLETAKLEYSRMLGESLAGPKLAMVEEIPHLEGLVAGMADILCPGSQKDSSFIQNITSTPMLAALLAAVVAHQFVYNRETAASNALKETKIKPPKSIRLVSAPARKPDPGQLMLEDTAATPMISDIKSAILQEQVEQLLEKIEEKKVEEKEDGRDAELSAKAEKLDSNTTVIHTANGPVVINANDPEANRILQERQEQLRSIMSGHTALPAEV